MKARNWERRDGAGMGGGWIAKGKVFFHLESCGFRWPFMDFFGRVKNVAIPHQAKGDESESSEAPDVSVKEAFFLIILTR